MKNKLLQDTAKDYNLRTKETNPLIN